MKNCPHRKSQPDGRSTRSSLTCGVSWTISLILTMCSWIGGAMFFLFPVLCHYKLQMIHHQLAFGSKNTRERSFRCPENLWFSRYCRAAFGASFIGIQGAWRALRKPIARLDSALPDYSLLGYGN